MIPIPLVNAIGFRTLLVVGLIGAAGTATAWLHGHLQVLDLQRQVATIRADWATERAAVASSALTETTRQHEATDEIQRLAAVSRVRLDAAARTVAAGGLRGAAVAFAAGPGAGADPAAACSCDAATGRATVLAELYGELDERAGRLAIYADQLELAGATCIAAYRAARGEAHASAGAGLAPDLGGSRGALDR